MKKMLLASCSLALATAFENDTCEVVLVKGSDGPVRVNKSDFDADQEKPTAERQFTKYTGKAEPEQSEPANSAGLTTGGPPLAAPSAPHFGGGENTNPTLIDPLKEAAAPVTHGENSRLVLKEGAKYFVVDGSGQKITDLDGIDPKGYKSEEGAWTAIRALPH